MTEKDPAERYQTPSELLADLTMAIAQIRGYKLFDRQKAAPAGEKVLLPSDKIKQQMLAQARSSGAVKGQKGRSYSTIAEMPAVQPISGLHQPVSESDAPATSRVEQETTAFISAAARPAAGSIYISVLQGNSNPKKIVLEENQEIAVGRDASQADVVIDDGMVSRRHCVLTKIGARVLVRDCGSLNGTYVNDNRIEIGSLVDVGGRIRVGHTVFEVRMG